MTRYSFAISGILERSWNAVWHTVRSATI